jgi:hypothetical protein
MSRSIFVLFRLANRRGYWANKCLLPLFRFLQTISVAKLTNAKSRT